MASANSPVCGHPKLSQARTLGLWGFIADGQSTDGLLEPVAPAFKFEHRTTVHQAVKDGGDHGCHG